MELLLELIDESYCSQNRETFVPAAKISLNHAYIFRGMDCKNPPGSNTISKNVVIYVFILLLYLQSLSIVPWYSITLRFSCLNNDLSHSGIAVIGAAIILQRNTIQSCLLYFFIVYDTTTQW